MNKNIVGFSKLLKDEKIDWIAKTYFHNNKNAVNILKQYWNIDPKIQELHDDFIENTISNFYIPLGVAPHFLINDKFYTIPMVTEESSVVAAAAKAAKFWAKRGGFKTRVVSTEKIGQVHFFFNGYSKKLITLFKLIKPKLFSETEFLTKNMQKRGGGILNIELIDKTHLIKNYYQLHATFDTRDSMGANFINSCLEQFAKTLKNEALVYKDFTNAEQNIDIVMSILSNYVPNCIVRAEVSCKVEQLAEKDIQDPNKFTENFLRAIQIAKIEPYRAVTHNKGIMNGVDAVVLATGNDFRATAAGVHAYACRNGQYSSLTDAKVEDGIFSFWIEIPLALGTIGGLTSLHPLANFNLEMLEKPSAKILMQIVAAAGLAQNFAALRSLITFGIQAGHMKMHLNNIISPLNPTASEKKMIHSHFKNHQVSHASVIYFINSLRI